MTEYVDDPLTIERELASAPEFKKLEPHPVKFGFLFRHVLPLVKANTRRVDALEKRLEELEQAQPTAELNYQGTWNQEHARAAGYSRNMGVTLSGSLWVCKTNGATSRPGSGSAEWQLAVKRGQAGALER